MVTSDHNPIDTEHKKVEFDNALYGSIGLESAFGALNTIFTPEESVEILTRGKERFKIKNIGITEGNPVNLSLFEVKEESVFGLDHIFSTSRNSIFLDYKVKGRALGVVTENGSLTV